MRNPPHPGAVIRDSCVGAEAVEAVARRLGVGAGALARVLDGHGRISEALARKMEAVGWSDAQSWMQLQAAYDRARERLRRTAPRAAVGAGREVHP